MSILHNIKVEFDFFQSYDESTSKPILELRATMVYTLKGGETARSESTIIGLFSNEQEALDAIGAGYDFLDQDIQAYLASRKRNFEFMLQDAVRKSGLNLEEASNMMESWIRNSEAKQADEQKNPA